MSLARVQGARSPLLGLGSEPTCASGAYCVGERVNRNKWRPEGDAAPIEVAEQSPSVTSAPSHVKDVRTAGISMQKYTTPHQRLSRFKEPGNSPAQRHGSAYHPTLSNISEGVAKSAGVAKSVFVANSTSSASCIASIIRPSSS